MTFPLSRGYERRGSRAGTPSRDFLETSRAACIVPPATFDRLVPAREDERRRSTTRRAGAARREISSTPRVRPRHLERTDREDRDFADSSPLRSRFRRLVTGRAPRRAAERARRRAGKARTVPHRDASVDEGSRTTRSAGPLPQRGLEIWRVGARDRRDLVGTPREHLDSRDSSPSRSPFRAKMKPDPARRCEKSATSPPRPFVSRSAEVRSTSRRSRRRPRRRSGRPPPRARPRSCRRAPRASPAPRRGWRCR